VGHTVIPGGDETFKATGKKKRLEGHAETKGFSVWVQLTVEMKE